MKAADAGLIIGIVLIGMMICIELVRSGYAYYCIRKELKYQKGIERYFAIVKERNASLKGLQGQMLQIKLNLKRFKKHVVYDETDKKYNRKYLPGVYRQNKVLLTLLDDYRCMAEQMNIRYAVRLDTSVAFPCNELDTVSLLGNLLDNAIEACVACKASVPVPYICVTLETFLKGEKKVVCLVLENSKSPAAHPVEYNFVTTKIDADGHGKGMTIIRGIVKKYDGHLFLEDKEERFVTSIEFWGEEEHV